jgi:hypothetical protein
VPYAPGVDDVAVQRHADVIALRLGGAAGAAVDLEPREAEQLAAVLRALVHDRLPPRPRWLGTGPPGELPARDGRRAVVVALDPDDPDRVLLEVFDDGGWPAESRSLSAADALALADRLAPPQSGRDEVER